ncbi:MAG TPA: UDP-N-acetylmuramoyl-tripeptide--D-alanyl-D-alanine ligase [Candidatus Avipropionibacterium avicola]|uniref:UDP-N-acetylmuramoyl-tripeptide--D-alanyl-D-alanine ligase n=1 Tax=Candidatus Avipropionibacterium avicola TaxID=2840701 RepID=A0A9D1GWJ5_9ACTN|nr:UDP-N-acetylmuramoyl-tripeptide--D-alanyl-D-alanine ligase [Candidatus Avipropionibacterium avicola]
MRPRSLDAVADLVGGTAHHVPATSIGPRVVIDSREVEPGALFVALPGDRVDGHRFVAGAVADGAGAALVAADRWDPASSDVPVVVVDDPRAALGRLSRALLDAEADVPGRTRPLLVLGITGSMGKTSTKDLVAHVLGAAAPTVAPRNSFNNEIGVPLTATAVDGATGFLVSEMGARGIGHITTLCEFTPPRIGVVLNVAHAHIGEFGSQQAIARAKGELVEALPVEGWAVLNADDPLVAAMVERTAAAVAWFSLGEHADRPRLPDARPTVWVGAAEVEHDAWGRHHFDLLLARGEEPPVSVGRVGLATPGRAQLSNALAAAAAAIAAGLEPSEVAASLDGAGLRSRWRMELHPCADDSLVVNDAYNANPDAVLGAVGTVAGMARDNQRRFGVVLGDMLELGDQAVADHRATGQAVAAAGASWAVFVGQHAGDQAVGARSAGLDEDSISEAADHATALEQIGRHHRSGDVVLVKGSRGMALETVADALVARLGPAAAPTDGGAA